MGCHQITAAQTPEVQKLQRFFQDGRPIPWVRLHKLPGFAYFPHKRHVAKGVECESCHGTVQAMTLVAQVAPLTMGWCVECHVEKRGAARRRRVPSLTAHEGSLRATRARDDPEGGRGHRPKAVQRSASLPPARPTATVRTDR
jgi:hypothetical protein